MKKLLAVAFITIILASCGTNYYACPGVDGGRPAKSCGRQLWYLGGSIPPLSQLKQYKLNK